MATLEELRAFATVYECRGFTRAAARLSITTNAVSMRIARLEGSLGVRLFIRTTRHVTPTDEARTYYGRIRGVLDELEAAGDDLHATGDGLRGSIRIGVPGPVATGVFLDRLRELVDANPHLAVQLRVSNAPFDLAAEGLDIALVVGQTETPTFVGRLLARVGWVLVATPGYLDRRGRPTRPAQLREHNCLRFFQNPPQDHWPLIDRRGRRQLVPVGGNFEADDSRTLGDAVYAGLGIGLRPIGESNQAVGRIERVLPSYRFEPMEVHALLPKGRLRVPRVAACLEALRAAVAELA